MNKATESLLNLFPKSVQELLADTLGVVLIKIAKVVVSLFLSIYLARILGSEGLGLLDLSVTFLQIAAFFIASGLNRFLVKEISVLFLQGNEIQIQNLIRKSSLIAVFLAIPLMLVGVFFGNEISMALFDDHSFSEPLFWAAMALIPHSIILIYAGSLNGLGQIWRSQLILDALKFMAIGFVIFIVAVFFTTPSLSLVLKIYTGAAYFSAAVGGFFLLRFLKWKKTEGPNWRSVYKSSLPFLLISATGIFSANIDKLMIGWLDTASQLGVYSASARLALMSNFFLTATIASYAPRVSRDYEAKNYVKVQEEYIRMALLLGLLGLVAVVLFIFLGIPILNLWGAEFELGYWPLVILALGQFTNLLTGATAVLLSFTGHQVWMSRIALITLLANVVLNFILIRKFSITGAAIATSISFVVSNALILSVVNRKTELNITMRSLFLKKNND